MQTTCVLAPRRFDRAVEPLNLVAKSVCRRGRIGPLLLALAGAGLPERRLSIATRESAINDIGAYNLGRHLHAGTGVRSGVRRRPIGYRRAPERRTSEQPEITSSDSEETIVYPSANCLPACSGRAIRLF
jgi:hypothetical protein